MTRAIRFLPALLAALIWLPAAAQAASDAEARGLAIMQEAERRDAGWRDMTARVTMLLKDRRGQTRERALRIMALEKPGNAGDKTLTIFDSPPDLAGTLFLSHAVAGADDRLWLFLPALKRVKRIGSSNKTGAFFASEFAYEDIAAQEIGKFTYRYVGDRPCAGQTCFVVERRPAYRNSGYGALVTYIDQSAYRVQRVEYFDRSGQPLKVLTMAGYRQYAGRFWRPSRMLMDNLKTGKSTVLSYSNYRFATGLRDADFESGNLRNVR